MDLETALSRPVPRDRCEGIVREALLRRRAELRKSWRHFISAECLASLGSFASEVESFLSGQDPIRDWRFVANFTWMNCEATFLDCLRAIALAVKFEYRPSDTGPAELSLLNFNKLSSKERIAVLCDRYRCPLNIGAASESGAAEELLRQLMVPDRAKLEAGEEFDADFVLLKLNFVGIRAMITRDLRFLDSLNYFYELPRRSLTRMHTNPRLFASWLCIYAQLLCAPDWEKCALR
jgi:hypothetical protein